MKSPKKWSGQNRTSRTGSYAYAMSSLHEQWAWLDIVHIPCHFSHHHTFPGCIYVPSSHLFLDQWMLIYLCQLLFSVAKFQCNINESTSEFNQLILGTIYGIWNLDFFHSFLPPLSPFCLTLRLCCSLVYTPCCWLSLACVYIQLNPRGCRVIVQDVSAAVDEGGEGSGTH